MTYLQTPITSPAGIQAAAVLKAWAAGDRLSLKAELNRSSEISAVLRNGGEEEQVELLKTVASQMTSCLNPFIDRPTGPQMRICVKLLTHLAASPVCFD